MELEVYCDESRQELAAHGRAEQAGEYVLIGSIWIEKKTRSRLKARVRSLRELHGVHGEFKWNKVSGSKLPFYEALIDLFFDCEAKFRCLVLSTAAVDVKRYHSGDPELMFYKFYYQLLHQWILTDNEYDIFVDGKTNRLRSRVRELGIVLQRANVTANVRRVQVVRSHESDMLQLADFLIGAVGFRYMPGRSSAKLRIVRRIEGYLGHPIRPTDRAESKFNIFEWRPGVEW